MMSVTILYTARNIKNIARTVKNIVKHVKNTESHIKNTARLEQDCEAHLTYYTVMGVYQPLDGARA